MRKLLQAAGLAALVTVLAGPVPVMARCEDVKPQPRPQHSPVQDIGRSFDRIREDGFIEFALYEDFAPWSYRDKGEAAGIDVEIGRLIAADLGLEARFRLVSASETLDADLLNYVWKGAAVDGHVSDVMLHVPYDSQLVCRIEQVSFTGQYAEERIAIAYRRAAYPDEPPVPAYFRFDTVAVENDSISDFYLTSLIGPVDTIHRSRSLDLAMDALAAGETMAAMGPRAQLEAGMQRHPESGIGLHEPPLVGLARAHWTIGAAVSLQHKDLGYAVDGAIEAALADGRLAAIFTHHGIRFTAPVR
jgi:ABC-type amino acid transport substrate-binding protein